MSVTGQLPVVLNGYCRYEVCDESCNGRRLNSTSVLLYMLILATLRSGYISRLMAFGRTPPLIFTTVFAFVSFARALLIMNSPEVSF